MSKRLILIVEDDYDIRTQLAEVFEGDGYPVHAAENGSRALEILRGLAELPALIFLDLMMPVLDGQGFLIELQSKPENARFAAIPVVVLSAVRHDIHGQVVQYVRKPPHLDQLIALAEKYASG